jgi:hypothetical protein
MVLENSWMTDDEDSKVNIFYYFLQNLTYQVLHYNWANLSLKASTRLTQGLGLVEILVSVFGGWVLMVFTSVIGTVGIGVPIPMSRQLSLQFGVQVYQPLLHFLG